MITSRYEVLRKGSKWLAAAREYLLTHAYNADHLQWNSDDEVKGLTVSDIEQLVADAIAVDRNER